MNLPRPLRWVLRGLAVLLALIIIGPFLVPLPHGSYASPADLAPGATFVIVDGTSTRIEEAGPVNGPVVVLVHGFGGSTFSFRHTIPALAAAGFRVLALDLPGFGLSEKQFGRDVSHPKQADFVVGVMRSRGIERATLLGHSMGGNVVVHVAERHPAVVDRLVLVSAAIAETGGARRGSTLGIPLGLGALARFPPTRRIARIVLRRTMTPDVAAARFRTAYADPSKATAEAARGYTQVLRLADWDLALLAVLRDGPRSGLAKPLASLAVPTLILWGESDTWVPLPRGRRLHDAIRNSRMDVMAGVGHLPMEEAPEAFSRVLIEFLRTGA